MTDSNFLFINTLLSFLSQILWILWGMTEYLDSSRTRMLTPYFRRSYASCIHIRWTQYISLRSLYVNIPSPPWSCKWALPKMFLHKTSACIPSSTACNLHRLARRPAILTNVASSNGVLRDKFRNILDHFCFLPHPFQFIDHHHPIIGVYIITRPTEKSVNK
jgi:hypothetical protein